MLTLMMKNFLSKLLLMNLTELRILNFEGVTIWESLINEGYITLIRRENLSLRWR